MFEVTKNGLNELKPRSMKGTEWKLQNWVVDNPRIFGSDFLADRDILEEDPEKKWGDHLNDVDQPLLIIQREYGFKVGQKQCYLDVLALDIEGNLVLIELKSVPADGKIINQVASYMTFVEKLKPKKIVEIYQEFLEDSNIDEDAEDNILDFFEAYYGEGNEGDISDLNPIGKQRIFIAADGFRSDVIETINQLKHDVTCFNINLYSIGGKKYVVCKKINTSINSHRFAT